MDLEVCIAPKLKLAVKPCLPRLATVCYYILNVAVDLNISWCRSSINGENLSPLRRKFLKNLFCFVLSG